MNAQAMTDRKSDEKPLWQPDAARMKGANITALMEKIGGAHGVRFGGYEDFWRWSVEHCENFWETVWDDCAVIGERGGITLKDKDKMPGAQFFPDARINYAENMLRHRGAAPAIIFRNEKGDERTYSFDEVYAQVSLIQQVLKAEGVGKGDRVAAYMPNIPETIFAMLAASSLGAIWSSASPDFGVQGIVDRFGQIEPKVLFAVDGYYYNGKTLDCLEKTREAVAQIPGLKKIIVVPFVNAAPDIAKIANAAVLTDMTKAYAPVDVTFTRVEFNHPLFIMFSSGTTGVPKCIVHGHGGTLIQHLKEHKYHCDINAGDRVFYFTTCGWMMWNWLVTGLASGACLLLFDGSPFYPNGNVLWDFTAAHGCKLFGTAAKYIDAIKNADLSPGKTHDLSALKTLTSTGSPLVHESFDYVYAHIKPDLHLASISGGTDIISCFVLGNPISAVWRGEIQGPGLGMAVDAFNDDGAPIAAGAGSGELVCTKPFPSMPVMFWNDEGGAKYRAAYFERFDNIWCHGDWIERTAHNGFIIHGRSDATLNPGGVRIGTAEIYRQVEQVEDVLESMAVGQDWQGDVRVILFVRLKPGVALNDELKKTIASRIRSGASPRHVPAKIIQVADIPRTKSNKITELAVRDIIHGRKVKNVEALANPDALDLYRDLPELQLE